MARTEKAEEGWESDESSENYSYHSEIGLVTHDTKEKGRTKEYSKEQIIGWYQVDPKIDQEIPMKEEIKEDKKDKEETNINDEKWCCYEGGWYDEEDEEIMEEGEEEEGSSQSENEEIKENERPMILTTERIIDMEKEINRGLYLMSILKKLDEEQGLRSTPDERVSGQMGEKESMLNTPLIKQIHKK